MNRFFLDEELPRNRGDQPASTGEPSRRFEVASSRPGKGSVTFLQKREFRGTPEA